MTNIYSCSERPAQIFFEKSPGYIQAFGSAQFDYHQGFHGELRATTFTEPEFTRHSEDSFHSFASLENVVEVTPCRSYAPGPSSIIGMLLLYATGKRACLGQCRLDRLDPPQIVEPGSFLWLGTPSGSHAQVVTCDIGVDPPSDPALTFFEAGWEGTLEWRVSAGGNRVRHKL